MFLSKVFQRTFYIADAAIGDDGFGGVWGGTPESPKVHGVGLETGGVECFHEGSGVVGVSLFVGGFGVVGSFAEEMVDWDGGPGASVEH